MSEIILEDNVNYNGDDFATANWNVSRSLINSPNTAPVLVGSVHGAYNEGTAEIEVMFASIYDVFHNSNGTVDVATGCAINITNQGGGTIGSAASVSTSYYWNKYKRSNST